MDDSWRGLRGESFGLGWNRRRELFLTVLADTQLCSREGFKQRQMWQSEPRPQWVAAVVRRVLQCICKTGAQNIRPTVPWEAVMRRGCDYDWAPAIP